MTSPSATDGEKILTRDEVEDAYNAASMYAIPSWRGYQDGNWNVKADFAAALCKLALKGLETHANEQVAWRGRAHDGQLHLIWRTKGDEDWLRRNYASVEPLFTVSETRVPDAQGWPYETALLLAAISTACGQNTRESAKQRIGKDNPYWTPAYEDACRAVDREMALREKLEDTPSAIAEPERDAIAEEGFARMVETPDDKSQRRLPAARMTDVISWAETEVAARKQSPSSYNSEKAMYLWFYAAAVLDLRDDVLEALRATPSATLPNLPADILALCKLRGWNLHWTHRGAYLHLEASELIEALRGKRGDPLHEAADVLLVLMSITENAGLPWSAVMQTARETCESLKTRPRYQGEEYEHGKYVHSSPEKS